MGPFSSLASESDAVRPPTRVQDGFLDSERFSRRSHALLHRSDRSETTKNERMSSILPVRGGDRGNAMADEALARVDRPLSRAKIEAARDNENFRSLSTTRDDSSAPREAEGKPKTSPTGSTSAAPAASLRGLAR